MRPSKNLGEHLYKLYLNFHKNYTKISINCTKWSRQTVKFITKLL